MTAIHSFLGLATLVLAAALLATATASAVAGSRLPSAFRAWLVDGLALVVEAAALIAALGGPLLLATGHEPGDILHVLYAVLALVALPAGLGVALSRRSSPGRRDGWLAIAALVLVGVAFRLVQTG